MQKFNVVKHGYHKQEVDAYLKKTALDYERCLAEQKDRIFELVESVKKLEAELCDYRKKDDEISHALVSAVQKAKEIEGEAQRRYDAEIARLRLFHSKWVRYYRDVQERYPVDSGLMSVENFVLEMNKILETDADSSPSFRLDTQSDKSFAASRRDFMRSYEQETQRVAKLKPAPNAGEAATKIERTAGELAKAGEFKPMERIGAYLNNTVKAKPQVSDTGFDLNEVLNPSTKLDLGELCQELGFLDD